MSVIKHTEKEIELLARLMRAEAEGEGELGMLMVGNVCVNRVRCDCLDFKSIRTITDMVYQKPGGFEAVDKSYFYQRAREKEIKLARRCVKGERTDPADFCLWFFRPAKECPPTWYNQKLSGRYKNHCFFQATEKDCPNIYNTF